MEILFVSHKFPPSVGGMEKQSFELINGMKQFAKVHTIVYKGRGSKLSFFLSLKGKISETCKNNPGISVIHFNDGLMAAFCLRHKAYKHLKRTVTLHGLDAVFPNTIYQRFILPKFNQLDLIFAVSHATARACINRGLSPEKIAVVNNGVDSEIAATKALPDAKKYIEDKYLVSLKSKRILVAMGRPVKRKGFSWFIQNVVPALEGDFVVLMIGPYQHKNSLITSLLRFLPAVIATQIELLVGFASDEHDMRKLLTNSKISDKVKHLGKLPLEDIIQILSVADGFVMPNIYVEGDMEGFGLVCLEASLCGTVVFASEIEGITDAIHHEKNGILLPAQNAGKWIAVLNTLIENPAEFHSLAEAGKLQTLKNFSWSKMVNDYWSHFSKLYLRCETKPVKV